MEIETVAQAFQTPEGELSPRRLWRRCYQLPLFVLSGCAVLLALAAFYHYAVYQPQPKQPHRLTVFDDVFAVGVVVLLVLVGLGLGRRVLRFFTLTDFTGLERCALAVSLGWGLLSLATLALGLVHLLYSWLLMAGLGVALLIFWRDVWGLLVALTSRVWYRRWQPLMPRTFFEGALVLMVAVELALVGTQALTLPIFPRGWDVYTYHWAVPRLFLLHHAVYAPPGWANADFPLNTEMLNMLALTFDAQVAATFMQMIFGLLAVLLISGFLYRCAGRLAAWLGVALCLASPLFTGLLTSGYVELAVACYGVASLVLVLAWLERRQQESYQQEGGLSRIGLLVLAGWFAGLGVGAKYQAGQTVVGIALLLAGVGVVRAATAWKKDRQVWLMLRPFLAGLMVYLLALALALLPWLLRDWLLLGNPIYPLVWGGPAWNAARTQVAVEWLDHFGPQGPLWRRLAEAFFRLFRDNGHMDDIPYQSLSYLLLFAPILVVLEAGRAWRRWQSRGGEVSVRAGQPLAWLVVAGGAYIAWVVARTTSARYALPWVLLLAVPAAILLARLCRACGNRPIVLMAIHVWLLAVFALQGPVSSWRFWSAAQPLSLLTGQVSLRQWEEKHLQHSAGYWQLTEYVAARLPAEAKLLLVGNGFGYFLEGCDYVADSAADWVPYLVTAGQTPSGMVALLRQEGFDYLVYQEQNLKYMIRVYQASSLTTYLPAFHQFLSGALIQIRVFGDYTLYRIPSS